MRHRTVLSAVLGLIALATASAPALADARRLANEQSVSLSPFRQRNPAVSLRSDGSGWIVWENLQQGLVGRRLSPDGQPVGAEIVLVANRNLDSIPAEGTVVWHKEPAVAALAGGGVAVAWSVERVHLVVDHFYERRELIDRFVHVQFFDANGVAAARRFRIDASGQAAQGAPRIAIGSDWAAVVWEETVSGPDTAVPELRGRILKLATSQLGEVFRIGNGPGQYAALAVDRADQLWVAWQAPDTSGDGVFVGRFHSNGRALGAAVRVNDTVFGCQRRPALAPRGGGGFWVFFHGPATGDAKQNRIYSRRVTPDGLPIGADQVVSEGDHQHEVYPSVAALGQGRYLVLWMSWWANWPKGFFGRELRDNGGVLESVGDPVRLNEFRAYTQFRTSLAAAGGRATTVWESLAPRQKKAGVSTLAITAGD